MNPFEQLYGPVGLGLITLFVPLLLQILKKLTGWKDDIMMVISLAVAYVLCDVFLLAIYLPEVPYPTVSKSLMLILGMLMYPAFVWLGMKGMYEEFPEPSPMSTLYEGLHIAILVFAVTGVICWGIIAKRYRALQYSWLHRSGC